MSAQTLNATVLVALLQPEPEVCVRVCVRGGGEVLAVRARALCAVKCARANASLQQGPTLASLRRPRS